MEEYNKTIYKKDSKGKIRFLKVSSNQGELIQESGLIDGKSVTHPSMCKPKNVGKVNETTPTEQAILEAESKIKTKMDGGYFNTIEEAKNEEVILPMLAKDYKKEFKKVTFPCFIQPKLDGMRCLVIIKNGEIKLISRRGKEITTMGHIVKDFKKIISGEDIIYDGELYAYGESFQRNMELIKKYRKGESELVKLHVYDVIINEPVKDRLYFLSLMFDGYNNLNPLDSSIEQVMDYIIDNEEELKTVHKRFISEGYEGTMVRWGDEGYKVNGRSSNLLKYKDFKDVSLPIKNVIVNDRNPDHGTPIFDWPGATDDILKAGTRLSHKEREDLLTNKDEYIGKIAEVRFFEYSDTGVPRFPVMVGVRLDK